MRLPEVGTPEWDARMKSVLEAIERSNETISPKPDGTCRNEECGGQVMRFVSGKGFGQTYYDVKCVRCHRHYYVTEKVAKRYPINKASVEQWDHDMNTPMSC
jgi:hypothetical protein